MIRPFQPEDLDAVVRLWLDANSQAHSFIPRSYWEEQREAVRAALPRAEVYVHQDQAGQIDGFIGLVGQWIEGIFVSQDARSQGVGRLLLDCAGVADVTGFTLNGSGESLVLDQDAVGVCGEILLEEVS